MGYVTRCAICHEQMFCDPERHLLGCPVRHRQTTDPDAYRFAHMSMLLEELDAFEKPSDDVAIDHPHRWITIERTAHETLSECVTCGTWRMGPP